MKNLLIIALIIIIPHLTYTQVTDGLVGHFDFTNGSLVDLAAYQDAALSQNGDNSYFMYEDRFGNPDAAIDFQGAVLEAGNNSRDITTEITISLWMKSMATPEDVKFLIHKYYCMEPPLGYHIGVLGDSVFIGGRDNSPNEYMVSGWSETSVNDGEWHHIIGLVKAEGTWELWVDAIKENSTTYSSISALNHSSCNMGIAGTDYIDETRIYHGVLDDIRIYNRALDSSEINSLYNELDPSSGINEQLITKFPVNIQPNPFNFTTSIEYSLKKQETVSLNIYNQFGQLVYSQLQEQSQGMQHLYWQAKDQPCGLYFLSIRAGNHHAIGKLMKVQ